jgi:thiaminase
MKTPKSFNVISVCFIVFMTCSGFAKTLPKTADQLISMNADQWYAATHHPFLNEVKDGTLSQEAFTSWLSQDYYFAGTLLDAQSLMLLYSPRSDQNLLIGGLFALDSELSWFEKNANIYNIDLTRPVLPTCQAYNDFLLALQYKPYVVQITCMWALNRAYFDSWSTALPGAPKYKEFIDRFTSLEYKDYIDALENLVNTALAASSTDQRAQAELYFLWVARYEKDFWDMALTGQ